MLHCFFWISIDFYWIYKSFLQHICATAKALKAKGGFCCSFNTTVWEQHPRSHHKGATSMQTHPEVRVGYELATNSIQFYVFAN